MNFTLHALKDITELHGAAFNSGSYAALGTYYLTDPAGNRLTDPSGNYLIVYVALTTSTLLLHALDFDSTLNTE